MLESLNMTFLKRRREQLKLYKIQFIFYHSPTLIPRKTYYHSYLHIVCLLYAPMHMLTSIFIPLLVIKTKLPQILPQLHNYEVQVQLSSLHHAQHK